MSKIYKLPDSSPGCECFHLYTICVILQGNRVHALAPATVRVAPGRNRRFLRIPSPVYQFRSVLRLQRDQR